MELNKPLHDITAEDLQGLLEPPRGESKTLDYKREIYQGKDDAKRKDKSRNDFCKDVSSFANTVGGHLVIGMAEKDGLPLDLCGMDIPSEDAFKLYCEDILQTKITPRIPGVDYHFVKLANDKKAVVVYTPQSFMKPHQIECENKDFQFWARNSAGNYRLDVADLRSIILQSESLNERIRSFRQERLGNIIAHETPITLRDGPITVYHLVPANAFSSQKRYDFTAVRFGDGREGVSRFGNKERFNLDGIVFYSFHNFPAAEITTNTYAQIFRNGIIEAVDTVDRDGNETRINGYTYNFRSFEDAKSLLKMALHLGVDLPLYLIVSLIGVKDYSLYIDSMDYDNNPVLTFPRDVIQLPDVQIDNYTASIEATLQPVLDSLWNAAGWERSLRYNAEGEWIDKPTWPGFRHQR